MRRVSSEIAVEHDIRRLRKTALAEVHQQKGEVVEHVARSDQRVELDGVEQHRPLVDEHDVAEMQVTMAAAHAAEFSAGRQQRLYARVGFARFAIECSDSVGFEQIGPLAERFEILVEIGFERGDPRRGLDDRRLLVGRGDGKTERVGQLLANLAGKMVEGARLVEAAHLDRPFDGRALAGDCQPSVGFAGDREHAAVDLRRERRVDGKLGLASLLAPAERRIVEKRKAHGALDFQRAIAGEKHRRRMGIDALDRVPAMACRIGEKA